MYWIKTYLTAAIISYLAGAVPFGLVIGRVVAKKDIRKFGSGNIGATNVTRVLGFKLGALVFVLDFLKGFGPVLFFTLASQHNKAFIGLLAATAAICGHNWSVFLKFKGGKGVSTTLGVICSLSLAFPFIRMPFLITVLVWLIVFYSTKVVAIASLACAASFLAAVFIYSPDIEFKAFALLIFIFIVIRHRPNIKLLLDKKKGAGTKE